MTDKQDIEQEAPCTDCGDTGVTFQTERACACIAGLPFSRAVPVDLVERLKEYRSAGWPYNGPAICFEAATEIEALRERVREWQPIETAPRDGTDVLLLRGQVSHTRSLPLIVLAHWSRVAQGFVRDMTRWQTIDATHWQPLPESPARQSLNKGS